MKGGSSSSNLVWLEGWDGMWVQSKAGVIMWLRWSECSRR